MLLKLQYFFNLLNYKYFDSELEPTIIKTSTFKGEEIEADFLFCCCPYCIRFNSKIIEQADELYLITILLHEMVHQYCDQHEIVDVTREGKHTSDFFKQAKEVGLIDGYMLSKELETELKKEIRSYNTIFEVF